MGDFQSKYDKQAMERALAAPKFEMPANAADDERLKPVRVVEKRGNVWNPRRAGGAGPRAPGGGRRVRLPAPAGERQLRGLERLKKADGIHRKAALEHEKEMAR
jgi:hypothetical protein